MVIAERIAAKLDKVGEQFTVGANTYCGVFKILDTGTMRNYLDDVEVMGVVRPGLLLVTEAEAVIAAGDHITRDGRTYEVLKTSQQRIADVAVVKIVVLA